MISKAFQALINATISHQLLLIFAMGNHKKRCKKSIKSQSPQSQWLNDIRLK